VGKIHCWVIALKSILPNIMGLKKCIKKWAKLTLLLTVEESRIMKKPDFRNILKTFARMTFAKNILG
jgi:hypothetical protein